MKIKAEVADTPYKRIFGLLDPRHSRFLLIHTHFGIHTFFLKEPIDVLVLGRHQQIVKMAKKLLPFRFFFYSPRFSTVLEMPQGTIKKLGLHLNDKIFIG